LGTSTMYVTNLRGFTRDTFEVVGGRAVGSLYGMNVFSCPWDESDKKLIIGAVGPQTAPIMGYFPYIPLELIGGIVSTSGLTFALRRRDDTVLVNAEGLSVVTIGSGTGTAP